MLFVAERIVRRRAPLAWHLARVMRGNSWHETTEPEETGLGAAPGAEETSASADYCRHVFDIYEPLCPPAGRVLEIGPGGSVGTCSLFALRGHEAWAIDRFAWDLPEDRSLYRALGTEATIPERRIGQAESIPFPDGHFDFVYSHATLEHVRDPEKAVAEIARVLAPGGVTAHQIDGADHRHRHDGPIEFLRVPEWAWRSLHDETDHFQNRWRSAQFAAAFRRHVGTSPEVRPGRRVEPAEVGDRRRFRAPFRTMSTEELSIVDFMIVASRPA